MIHIEFASVEGRTVLAVRFHYADFPNFPPNFK